MYPTDADGDTIMAIQNSSQKLSGRRTNWRGKIETVVKSTFLMQRQIMKQFVDFVATINYVSDGDNLDSSQIVVPRGVLIYRKSRVPLLYLLPRPQLVIPYQKKKSITNIITKIMKKRIK